MAAFVKQWKASQSAGSNSGAERILSLFGIRTQERIDGKFFEISLHEPINDSPCHELG